MPLTALQADILIKIIKIRATYTRIYTIYYIRKKEGKSSFLIKQRQLKLTKKSGVKNKKYGEKKEELAEIAVCLCRKPEEKTRMAGDFIGDFGVGGAMNAFTVVGDKEWNA